MSRIVVNPRQILLGAIITVAIGSAILYKTGSVLPGMCIIRQDDHGGELAEDLEKLQGTWIAVSGEAHGLMIPPEKMRAGKLQLIINGKNLVITSIASDGVKVLNKTTVALGMDKKAKTIDISGGFASGEGTLSGIYRLEKETLTWCYGNPRPNDFKTQADWTFALDRDAGAGAFQFEFKRSDDDSGAPALKELQGTWIAESIESHGERVSTRMVKDAQLRLRIESNKFTMTKAGGKYALTGMIIIDANERPRPMDLFAIFAGAKLEIISGVYELDGGSESLRFCCGVYGQSRPREFRTKADWIFDPDSAPGVFLYQFKREITRK